MSNVMRTSPRATGVCAGEDTAAVTVANRARLMLQTLKASKVFRTAAQTTLSGKPMGTAARRLGYGPGKKCQSLQSPCSERATSSSSTQPTSWSSAMLPSASIPQTDCSRGISGPRTCTKSFRRARASCTRTSPSRRLGYASVRSPGCSARYSTWRGGGSEHSSTTGSPFGA